ncbi:hypothetical protein [Streptomyces sp. NPDC048560]|uniref:hypothetical protein n=1 Tax=Streptomyces sp. NPDC048560 TaxID=3155488 RepID=UPI003437E358
MPAPVGTGSPAFGVGSVPAGAADGFAPEALGSGFAPGLRSDCASAWLPPYPERPDPGTVPPSGASDAPFGSDDDLAGARFPPSSPTLIQPVDAAIVSAVTAAHRTGADNWRTGGTSGA